MQQFVLDLLSTGRVRLKDDKEPAPDDSAAGLETLVRLETEFRAELPGLPPRLDSGAVGWALTTVYGLCQFHVYRHLGPDDAAARFGGPSPESTTASVHYSVDTVLRFLPDIERLIRSTSPEDPLLDTVRKLAGDWPLSSVGISNVEVSSTRLEPILQHDCLRQMYVDRVIASRDTSRSEHPVVSESIRQVAGGYGELTDGVLSKNELKS